MDEPLPVPPPEFTQHRFFWPLIALIAIVFIATFAVVLRSATTASPSLDEVELGSCMPAYLRELDRPDGAVAGLPMLPGSDLDAVLQTFDPNAPTQTTASECSVPAPQ